MRSIFTLFIILFSAVAAAAPDSAKLDLASVSVLIKDLDTQEVLYERNADRVQPIASLTKLMTGLVTLDGRLPMKERITIEVNQIPEMRNVHSRIRVGSNLPRADVLHIALMSSENRAAATLAHAYPGGAKQFIDNMNWTAQGLSMTNTRFQEPTGLSEKNVSTANDLMRLLEAVSLYPTLSKVTTSSKRDVIFKRPRTAMAFFNTNTLVNKKSWSIQISKTGYTDDAGRCLVLKTRIKGRNLGIVLLDSYGKRTHLADAQRIKRWLEKGSSGKVPKGAANYRDQKLKSLMTASR
jgi:D-alanyl-D-alanine endopeptidase (penicillin-binding protein 7)